MAKKETAEQKLLQMIETTSGDAEGSKSKDKVAKKQSALGLAKAANKILIVGVIVAAIFLSYEIKSGIDLINKKVSFSVDQGMINRAFDASNLVPTVQKLSFYLSGVKRRNLFQPFESAAPTNIVEVSPQDKKIVQKTQHLKLVGISWLDTVGSATVMLEDTSKNVTHFLKKGDNLGKVAVETIFADSVELGYENEEIIIRYDKSHM